MKAVGSAIEMSLSTWGAETIMEYLFSPLRSAYSNQHILKADDFIPL
jgi:hypothetical protein